MDHVQHRLTTDFRLKQPQSPQILKPFGEHLVMNGVDRAVRPRLNRKRIPAGETSPRVGHFKGIDILFQ